MLKHITFSLVLLFTLSNSTRATLSDTLSRKDNSVVIIIPVSGTVDQGMSAFITRALHETQKYPKRIIVLEMDTFGGEVDAAFQIVDTMVNVKDAITIAYVKTKAISAGALIALSCKKLVMQNNTTIGDVAPLTYGNDGPKMLGEKFQSPIRAKFRTLAKRNGYPERLTEAMVTEGLSVYEVHFPDSVVYMDSTELAELKPEIKKKIISTTTIDKSNELLTMDDVEAHKLGFSKMSVSSMDEMLSKMGYQKLKIIRMETTWSEVFVRFMGTISPLLMMIGLAALYMELKSPGFGLPGIVAICCLGLVFFSQFAIGLADYSELLLIGLGVLLILVEIFILPGFGAAGITGMFLVALGLVLSFQGFVIPKPEFPWQMQQLTHNVLKVFGSIIGSFVLFAVFFRFVFPRLGMVVKGPYLMADLREAKSDSDMVMNIAPGTKGTAESILRPAGKALFNNNERYDVVTEGDFIEKGSAIVVLDIQGNRIIVSRDQEKRT
jgi:membrane-bound serine protease (ClpP class)